MKKRISIIFLLLIFGYCFLPVRPFSRLIPDDSFDMVITGQQMGCPCPPFRIVRGKIDIPDNLILQYPGLHEDKIILKSNWFVKNINYEVSQYEIYVKGRFISVEHISEGEYAPVFEVKSWKVKNYIPMILASHSMVSVIYLFLALVIFLNYLIIARKFTIRRLLHNNTCEMV